MAQGRMPDAFFDIAVHPLPREQPVGPTGGRPCVGPRVVFNVLWFVLATGWRWEDVPPRDGLLGHERPPLPAPLGGDGRSRKAPVRPAPPYPRRRIVCSANTAT